VNLESSNFKSINMKEITVQELKALMDNKEDFQLIDVREQHEVDAANINGEHIPMGQVMNHLDKISKDKKVIIHCRSGARSGSVVQALETNFAYSNLYNLKGGIMAWAREIDPSMDVA
jgi:sulfur-carrier protein adenylyltransferase/sulfurtransferase